MRRHACLAERTAALADARCGCDDMLGVCWLLSRGAAGAAAWPGGAVRGVPLFSGIWPRSRGGQASKNVPCPATVSNCAASPRLPPSLCRGPTGCPSLCWASAAARCELFRGPIQKRKNAVSRSLPGARAPRSSMTLQRTVKKTVRDPVGLSLDYSAVCALGYSGPPVCPRPGLHPGTPRNIMQ